MSDVDVGIDLVDRSTEGYGESSGIVESAWMYLLGLNAQVSDKIQEEHDTTMTPQQWDKQWVQGTYA